MPRSCWLLAKHGLHPPVDELWGPVGAAYLDQVELPHGYTVRLESLRDLVGAFDAEVAMLEREIFSWLKDDAGYWAIQAIEGVGRTMAAIFVAEIGEVSRFSSPQALCSWPASSSPSSTTACATARSDGSPKPRGRGEPDRTQPWRAFGDRHDPHHGGVVDEVIEPAWLWPQTTMRPLGAKRCLAAGSRPALPDLPGW